MICVIPLPACFLSSGISMKQILEWLRHSIYTVTIPVPNSNTISVAVHTNYILRIFYMALPLRIQFHNHLLNEFLSEWQLRRKELNEKIITEEEYSEWMMNFPATSDDCGKSEPIKKW